MIGGPCRRGAAGAGRRDSGEPAAAAITAATARGLGSRPPARDLGSSFEKVSVPASSAAPLGFLCRLSRGLGFPATPSRCLLLEMCCFSWTSELTLTLQISQWKVRSWAGASGSPGVGGPKRG